MLRSLIDKQCLCASVEDNSSSMRTYNKMFVARGI